MKEYCARCGFEIKNSLFPWLNDSVRHKDGKVYCYDCYWRIRR